ncbi:16S rRNA (guanine(966)-N(2))-methyltransferase RsmD [Hydrogenimonas cancrithermarum]|uniref:DNA methylase n=1 Tax=Hydrogenimonas cancrithermarum TaxID=2993563 RepID=A0ABM8FK25_9BACT|nr:16S rRNA (guanine(966)-N(2))-methyltransferase RsmD [Hydrogenimonas cancrithermarum]BDY12007.1 DNA methylase [Hydrogenimonas cancrithermarum]
MKRDDKTLTTKIIGGKYRGKKISLPAKTVTRSSKARLKESLFNTLQFDLIDRNFIEMFGGSGSVGLEAISRGAKRAWFVELDRDAVKTLRNNCESIDKERCDIRFGDAFEIVPTILYDLERSGEKTYLYIDPPFSIREGHEDIYSKVIELMRSIDPKVIHMIIVEHMTKVPFPETVGAFEKVKFKKFGKSSLSYYSPK